jgi:SAM-dependent methyltransferase
MTYARFVMDYLRFRRLSSAGARQRLAVRWKHRNPRLRDRTAGSVFDKHYVYHTAWAMRALAELRPHRHVDIASSVYFAALASAFVPCEFYDFRPASIHLPNLRTGRADLLALPFESDSIPSLSCMHVVEHVGLGRYGDEIDPDGDLKACGQLTRVLAPGGSLLFVVPVGQPRVVFNAHRVYSLGQVRQALAGLELKSSVLISMKADGNPVLSDPAEDVVAAERYGCGCFWFLKPAP